MMPGVATAIAWMLDPVACAGMATIVAPRVALSALLDLHHLLIAGGFRRSSRDDPIIVEKEQREEPAHAGAAVRFAPTQHGARFGQASGDEPIRTRGGARPAGRPPAGGRRRRGGERDDDER